MGDEFVILLMGIFGAAWGAWVLFCIILVILWCLLPIFVIMMNSKLKKINQNLVYIAEGKAPPKEWAGFPTPEEIKAKRKQPDPVQSWLDKDDSKVIDLTDISGSMDDVVDERDN